MPIPIAIASFNRKVTNRLTGPFAGHLPGFAVVMHRGRMSGRMYHTPVNAFRRDDDYVFAMTYGPDVDWVRNVEAAGECDVETRGRLVHLVQPQRFRDSARSACGSMRDWKPSPPPTEYQSLVRIPTRLTVRDGPQMVPLSCVPPQTV